MSPPTHLEERFLVLAPIGRDGALTSALLGKAGLSCHVCRDLVELCERLEQEGAAALLIAEEVFVNGSLARLVELLAKQGSWSDIPVLIFTGKPATLGPRVSSTQLLSSLGNVTLLDRPLRPVTMISAARTALRARRRQYNARAELFAQQRAVRERDQFLAMLGHELRNPLSAITMALNLERDNRLSKYREIVRRQVGHLTRLVDDLLDVSRVTSGKIVLRREDIEVRTLVKRCISAIAPNLSNDTTLQQLNVDGPPVWVNADPVRLEQVLTHLLFAAVKYTPEGGRVRVGTEMESGPTVRLDDMDLPDGMRPDLFPHLYYGTISNPADVPGPDRGLAVAKRILDAHHATVALSDRPGDGTSLHVVFPYAQMNPADLIRDLAVA